MLIIFNQCHPHSCRLGLVNVCPGEYFARLRHSSCSDEYFHWTQTDQAASWYKSVCVWSVGRVFVWVCLCIQLHAVYYSDQLAAVIRVYWKNIFPKSQSYLKHKQKPQSYFLSQVSNMNTRVLGLFQVTKLSMYVEPVVHSSGVSLNSLSSTIKALFNGKKNIPSFWISLSKFAS